MALMSPVIFSDTERSAWGVSALSLHERCHGFWWRAGHQACPEPRTLLNLDRPGRRLCRLSSSFWSPSRSAAPVPVVPGVSAVLTLVTLESSSGILKVVAVACVLSSRAGDHRCDMSWKQTRRVCLSRSALARLNCWAVDRPNMQFAVSVCSGQGP